MLNKLFFLLILFSVFVGCDKKSSTGSEQIPSDHPPLPEFLAKVRVINVAESLGAVNVNIGGEAMGSVNVGEAGAYKTIDAGTKEFTVGGVTDTLVLGTEVIGSVFVIDEAQDPDDNFVISTEWSLDDFTNPALVDTVAKIIVAQMSSDTLELAMTLDDVAGWTHPGDRNLRLMTIDVDAGPDTLTVTKGAITVEIPLDITGGTSTTVVITGTIDDLQSFILDNALV